MKKITVVVLAMAVILTTGLFSLSAVGSPENTANVQSEAVSNSRFENMLNNNYVYAGDFHSVSAMANGAQLSLIARATDGVLNNADLIAFMIDMYGVDPSVFADEGQSTLDVAGTTVIEPRGYTRYTHKVKKTHTNDDGTVTVYTTVIANDHDSENAEKLDAIACFVPNPDSVFGYNLLSCELLLPETAGTDGAAAL